MRRIGVVLGLMLGCSSASEPSVETVVVETARSRYGPSDDIELTIRNRAAAAIRYSVCPGTLEHRHDGTWVRSEQLMLCSDDTTLLEGGSSRVEVLRLEGVERGEHRVIVRLFAPEGEASSNSFVVE